MMRVFITGEKNKTRKGLVFNRSHLGEFPGALTLVLFHFHCVNLYKQMSEIVKVFVNKLESAKQAVR